MNNWWVSTGWSSRTQFHFTSEYYNSETLHYNIFRGASTEQADCDSVWQPAGDSSKCHWVWLTAPSLTFQVTFEQAVEFICINLFVLQNRGVINAYPSGLLWGLSKTIRIKCLKTGISSVLSHPVSCSENASSLFHYGQGWDTLQGTLGPAHHLGTTPSPQILETSLNYVI